MISRIAIGVLLIEAAEYGGISSLPAALGTKPGSFCVLGHVMNKNSRETGDID
jgi:hypothetical protein